MPERTLSLAQVVGHLKVARTANNRAGTALRNGLKDTHVTGLNRTFTPDDEEKRALQQNADQYKAVPLKVMDQLQQDADITATALDWALTQDVANCSAKADVIVDGEVLLSQVPISHLLHLEKVFSEHKEVILVNLPILDPSKNWTWVPERKLWRADAEHTGAFIKQSKALVLHPGNDKHAPNAVVDPNPLETHIGRWETVVWSGAVSEEQKRELLAKSNTLIAAIKDAIAVADHQPAQKQAEGDKLFRFLLG